MDELLAKQVLRQLRILNTFLITFAVIFMVFFLVAGIFVYKAVQEVRQAKESLTTLQSKVEGSINLKSQICDSSSSASELLKNRSSVCE